MGRRLHSATKHEVVYGTNGAFNYAQDVINPIIEILAEEDCGYDDDCVEYANSISANRANLIKNVERIKTPDENWEYQDELNDMIEDMESNEYCGCDREYLYTQLKTIINQSDPNCEDVHFAWF